MKRYIESELLKYKRSLAIKILIIVPIVAAFLGMTMPSKDNANLMFMYNCWYIMLFPFLVAWIPGSNIAKEKKYCYHGMFCVVRDKKKLWLGKVWAALILLVVSMIMFVGLASAIKVLMGGTFTIKTLVGAAIVLFITFAWQVPVGMMLTQKFNIYVATVVSIIGNLIIGVVFIATESIWWLPYGISSRLMCPIISTLPNGVHVSTQPQLDNNGVIIPGIILSLIYFIIAMSVTKKMFDKEEL